MIPDPAATGSSATSHEPQFRMPKGVKRPKASRACFACRKLKARCELARDDSGEGPRQACHRCKTLSIECIFGNERSASSGEPSTKSKRKRAQVKPEPANDQVWQDDVDDALDDFGLGSLGFGGSAPRTRLLPFQHRLPREALYYSRQSDHRWVESMERCINVLALMLGRDPRPNPPHLGPPPHSPCRPPIRARPHRSLEELRRATLETLTAPVEAQLMRIFRGMHAFFLPCLDLPKDIPTSLKVAVAPASAFLIATVYLVALDHLPPTRQHLKVRACLRAYVDALGRLHHGLDEHNDMSLLALYTLADLVLWPCDPLAKDARPAHVEDDGLLEYSSDLTPRSAIRTAMQVAFNMGYYDAMIRLDTARSPGNGSSSSRPPDYEADLRRAFMWCGLVQGDAMLDCVGGAPDARFDPGRPVESIGSHIASMLPAPDFLSFREKCKLIWVARRAEFAEGAVREIRWWHTHRNVTGRPEEQLAMHVYEPSKRLLEKQEMVENDLLDVAQTSLSVETSSLDEIHFLIELSRLESSAFRTVISDYQLWVIARLFARTNFGSEAVLYQESLLNVIRRGSYEMPYYDMLVHARREGILGAEKVVAVSASAELFPSRTPGNITSIPLPTSPLTSVPSPTLVCIPQAIAAAVAHSFVHLIEAQVSNFDARNAQLDSAATHDSLMLGLLRALESMYSEVTFPAIDGHPDFNFRPMNPLWLALTQALRAHQTSWTDERKLNLTLRGRQGGDGAQRRARQHLGDGSVYAGSSPSSAPSAESPQAGGSGTTDSHPERKTFMHVNASVQSIASAWPDYCPPMRKHDTGMHSAGDVLGGAAHSLPTRGSFGGTQQLGPHAHDPFNLPPSTGIDNIVNADMFGTFSETDLAAVAAADVAADHAAWLNSLTAGSPGSEYRHEHGPSSGKSLQHRDPPPRQQQQREQPRSQLESFASADRVSPITAHPDTSSQLQESASYLYSSHKDQEVSQIHSHPPTRPSHYESSLEAAAVAPHFEEFILTAETSSPDAVHNKSPRGHKTSSGHCDNVTDATTGQQQKPVLLQQQLSPFSPWYGEPSPQ